MSDKVPISNLAVGYALLMSAVHVVGAGLGIWALTRLAGDALPGWQTAVLEQAMFFVPLFVVFEQFFLVTFGAYPKHPVGMIGQAVPLIATAVISYAWSDGSWARVWFDLAMPMLGVTGLIWIAAGIVWPTTEFFKKPGLESAGTALTFFAVYAIFIIPSVGVLVSIFTYAGSGLLSAESTTSSALLVASMAGIILAEAFRYATIFAGSRGGYPLPSRYR